MVIWGRLFPLNLNLTHATCLSNRASKRMDGEDVFGSKIRAIYSSELEFKAPVANQYQTRVQSHGGNNAKHEPSVNHESQRQRNQTQTQTQTKGQSPLQPLLSIRLDDMEPYTPRSRTTVTWKSNWTRPTRSDSETSIVKQRSSNIVYNRATATSSTSNSSNCPTSENNTSASSSSSRDSSPAELVS